MIERGLVIAGSVVAGTDFVIRDSDAWWDPGDRGTRQRASTMGVKVGHWTGGESTVRSYEDDGRVVVRNMKARLRPDGTPMSVAVHFVIGACDPLDPYANVWQTADPGLTACIHIGSGALGARSIATEVVSAGMPGPADVRDRPTVMVPLLGRLRKVLQFYPGQLAAWVRLCEALAGVKRAGIDIPRRVPSVGASRRLTLAESRRWSGGLEHLHVPGTTKNDAAGLLVGALVDAGWDRATP